MLESRQTLVWGSDLPSREAYDLQVSAPARLPELQSHVLPRAVHPLTNPGRGVKPWPILTHWGLTLWWVLSAPEFSMRLAETPDRLHCPLPMPASFHRCWPWEKFCRTNFLSEAAPWKTQWEAFSFLKKTRTRRRLGLVRKPFTGTIWLPADPFHPSPRVERHGPEEQKALGLDFLGVWGGSQERAELIGVGPICPHTKDSSPTPTSTGLNRG